MTKLYHKDICLPHDYKVYTDAIISKPYIFSHHLLERLEKADRSHNITIKGLNYAIYKIRFKCLKPFEIEMKDDKIVKCVIRIKYNNFQDISIVFLDKGDYVKIKSAWLNNSKDSHMSLDITKYESEI
jgi:beta-lactamase superfamily II metal-dependent hydrolase